MLTSDSPKLQQEWAATGALEASAGASLGMREGGSPHTPDPGACSPNREA